MNIRGFWSRYAFYAPGDVAVFDDNPFIAVKPVQGMSPNENGSWVPFNKDRRYPHHTQEFEQLSEFEPLRVIAASDIGHTTPVTIIGEQDGLPLIDYVTEPPVAGFTTEFVLKGRETTIATKGIIKADDWLRGGCLSAEYLEPGRIYYLGKRVLTLEDTGYPMLKALSYLEAEIL